MESETTLTEQRKIRIDASHARTQTNSPTLVNDALAQIEESVMDWKSADQSAQTGPFSWHEFAGESSSTTKVQIEIGSAKLANQETGKLRAGSVIGLRDTVEEPVRIVSDGKVIARGEILTVDGKLALRITELTQHLKELG